MTATHLLTTRLNDLEAGPRPGRWANTLPVPDDPLSPFDVRRFLSMLGYIGIAVRGTGAEGQSRAYVHFTSNTSQGHYSGMAVPELNNHLSRLDY